MPKAFDFVTSFDAIHDQANPLGVLTGIRKSLAPGGVYIAQDIKGSSHHHENVDHPLGPLLYTISCLHCMTVSLAQGGEGLGAMWGQAKGPSTISGRPASHRSMSTKWITISKTTGMSAGRNGPVAGWPKCEAPDHV